MLGVGCCTPQRIRRGLARADCSVETVALQPARCLLLVGADDKQRVGTGRLAIPIDHPHAPMRDIESLTLVDVLGLKAVERREKFIPSQHQLAANGPGERAGKGPARL